MGVVVANPPVEHTQECTLPVCDASGNTDKTKLPIKLQVRFVVHCA